MMMKSLYVLRDGKPVQEPDPHAWTTWIETANRIVVRTLPEPGVRVSTVFLGMDYSHDGGPPLLWETMVFGGALDGETWRYASVEEALRGHEEAVLIVRARL